MEISLLAETTSMIFENLLFVGWALSISFSLELLREKMSQAETHRVAAFEKIALESGGPPERVALLFWACLRPLLAAQNKNPALLKGKSSPAQGLRSGPPL